MKPCISYGQKITTVNIEIVVWYIFLCIASEHENIIVTGKNIMGQLELTNKCAKGLHLRKY